MLPYFEDGQEYTKFPNLQITCLPEILRDAGYGTHWFLGYNYHYANHVGFLSSHGFSHVYGQKDMTDAGFVRDLIGWGVADEDTFRYGVSILNKSAEPFFAEFLTLSNHHPFDMDFRIPDPVINEANQSGDRLYRNYLRGVHYTDYAVAKLIEEARLQPWFDRTVFIFVGDHGIRAFPDHVHGRPTSHVEKTELYFRSSFFIWAPKLIQPKRFEEVGSQVDIPPTVLDLVNVSAPNSFAGVSLISPLRKDGRRFAIMLTENGWSIREGNDYCLALGQSCFVNTYPECPEGQKPEFKGHSCFALGTEIVDRPTHDFLPLDEVRERSLIERGSGLVGAANFLMDMELIFPREMRRLSDPMP